MRGSASLIWDDFETTPHESVSGARVDQIAANHHKRRRIRTDICAFDREIGPSECCGVCGVAGCGPHALVDGCSRPQPSGFGSRHGDGTFTGDRSRQRRGMPASSAETFTSSPGSHPSTTDTSPLDSPMVSTASDPERSSSAASKSTRPSSLPAPTEPRWSPSSRIENRPCGSFETASPCTLSASQVIWSGVSVSARSSPSTS